MNQLVMRKIQRSQGIGKRSVKPFLEGVRRAPVDPLAANMCCDEHVITSKGHQNRRGHNSGTTMV